MIHIPMPESIPFARDPQRDRDIDAIRGWIANAGKAGLRGLNYNFTPVGYQRTEMRYGRGGSGYSSFEFSKYDNEEPHEAGRVDHDEIFARIQYFLEGVIPVAEEYGVQMACHLPDPPALVLRGEERWNYPVFEGLKRFSELVDSQYHGFQLLLRGSPPRGSMTRGRSCRRSSSTSPRKGRSSTSTSVTSAAGSATSSRSGRTKGTSTCTSWRGSFTGPDTRTC